MRLLHASAGSGLYVHTVRVQKPVYKGPRRFSRNFGVSLVLEQLFSYEGKAGVRADKRAGKTVHNYIYFNNKNILSMFIVIFSNNLYFISYGGLRLVNLSSIL